MTGQEGTPAPRSHGSGVHGASSHGVDCSCTRCRGFQPGHELSAKGGRAGSTHGAYRDSSFLAQHPRVVQLADELRAAMGALYRPDDLTAIRLTALCLLRLEQASGLLVAFSEPASGESVADTVKRLEASPSLSRDARGWANSAAAALRDLGLTPASSADLARTRAEVVALGDVRAVLQAIVRVAGAHVAVDRRARFLEEMDLAVGSLLGLPAAAAVDDDVQVVDGTAVELEEGSA